jgi:hypothetical protein
VDVPPALIRQKTVVERNRQDGHLELPPELIKRVRAVLPAAVREQNLVRAVAVRVERVPQLPFRFLGGNRHSVAARLTLTAVIAQTVLADAHAENRVIERTVAALFHFGNLSASGSGSFRRIKRLMPPIESRFSGKISSSETLMPNVSSINEMIPISQGNPKSHAPTKTRRRQIPLCRNRTGNAH